MLAVKIRRMGNSLGIIIPHAYLKTLGLHENSKINLTQEDGTLVISSPMCRDPWCTKAAAGRTCAHMSAACWAKRKRSRRSISPPVSIATTGQSNSRCSTLSTSARSSAVLRNARRAPAGSRPTSCPRGRAPSR